jgi:aldose 1-epimerase
MTASSAATTVSTRGFGRLPDGTEAQLITLRSAGLELEVCNFGARVVALRTPDRLGRIADIALGYGQVSTYETARNAFLGATAGRVANRIARGTFTLDGEGYTIPCNNGVNALHGGTRGFDLQMWEPRMLADGVEFALRSPAGDQGFPGDLHATASYRVAGNQVRLGYTAVTSRPTFVNLTNHTYFNLDGEGQPSILDHLLTLEADQYTPVDPLLIPTGKLADVAGTPFDFREPNRIGDRIDQDDLQLQRAGGYDHNFVVRGMSGTLRPVARTTSPSSGRVLEVSTTEPGVQFYSGNFLDGTLTGVSGKQYQQRSAFCLETQHFPDSPNQPAFPSIRLDPGQRFESETVWTLSAK